MFKQAPLLASITALFVCGSLALLLISFPFAIAIDNNPTAAGGFFEKVNWSLQPLFWPILALLVHYSWHLYEDAWRELYSHEILWKGDKVCVNKEGIADFLESLNKTRPRLIVISIALGIFLTAIDAGCLWQEYGIFGSPEPSCSEPDFSIAFRLPIFPDASNSTANGWFVFAAYLLQGGLIAFAWLAFLQIAVHSYSFLNFENRPANIDQLEIRLNYRDKLNEFGLRDVNRAINITYIFIAIGMVLPILSAYNNPQMDLGQWLLRVFLPLILLLPAVVPMAERVKRIKKASERMKHDPDKNAAKDFAKQKLWPFEQTQIGYLGKIAAGIVIIEYGYLVTRNLAIFF